MAFTASLSSILGRPLFFLRFGGGSNTLILFQSLSGIWYAAPTRTSSSSHITASHNPALLDPSTQRKIQFTNLSKRRENYVVNLTFRIDSKHEILVGTA